MRRAPSLATSTSSRKESPSTTYALWGSSKELSRKEAAKSISRAPSTGSTSSLGIWTPWSFRSCNGTRRLSKATSGAIFIDGLPWGMSLKEKSCSLKQPECSTTLTIPRKKIESTILVSWVSRRDRIFLRFSCRPWCDSRWRTSER